MRGFTIVELLIVIGIIGILSVALLLTLNPIEQAKKGRDVQRKADLGNIQKALELYYNDNSKYPDSLSFGSSWTAGSTIYMKKVSQDPKSGQNYVYQQESGGKGYRLYAALERCQPEKCYDPQACNNDGSACTNVGSLSCGSGLTCTYGVSSANLSP